MTRAGVQQRLCSAAGFAADQFLQHAPNLLAAVSAIAGSCALAFPPPNARSSDGTAFALYAGVMKTHSGGNLSSIESRILVLRGDKAMLDEDLAQVYSVPTGRLNQAVKRNLDRFPADFVFQLTAREWRSLKSQIVTSNEGRGGRRKLPWVFTEHGAIMAAMVLNSPRAVEMSVFVVRAFARLRMIAGTHAELAAKLAELESRVTGHDADLRQVIAALRALIRPSRTPRRKIGFAG